MQIRLKPCLAVQPANWDKYPGPQSRVYSHTYEVYLVVRQRAARPVFSCRRYPGWPSCSFAPAANSVFWPPHLQQQRPDPAGPNISSTQNHIQMQSHGENMAVSHHGDNNPSQNSLEGPKLPAESMSSANPRPEVNFSGCFKTNVFYQPAKRCVSMVTINDTFLVNVAQFVLIWTAT